MGPDMTNIVIGLSFCVDEETIPQAYTNYWRWQAGFSRPRQEHSPDSSSQQASGWGSDCSRSHEREKGFSARRSECIWLEFNIALIT